MQSPDQTSSHYHKLMICSKLGKSKFFSTLDLAAEYWQIGVKPDLREKTAFVTNSGLYKFCVMPFGLKNSSAFFQHLTQQVLAELSPVDGPDFVSVYLDDVLVFSETLYKHLTHLQCVLERIKSAGLKLKPGKCHFRHQEVDYLGLLETCQDLSAVRSDGKYILCPETPATTNCSALTFPDSHCRHPGVTLDLQGEPVCCCLPGLPFKGSSSVPGPRPKVVAIGEIACEGSCTPVWCPRGTAV